MHNSVKAFAMTTAAVLLAGAQAANAQQAGAQGQKDIYNYIEGRYILDAEVGPIDDGDGFRFEGSYRVNNEIFVFGNLESVEFDFGIDLDLLEVGAGYIYPLQNGWDFNATVSLLNADVENEDEDGFALSAGTRGMLNAQIQLRGEVTYADLEDSDTYITIGADYFFDARLSAGVEMDMAGDYERLSVGVRYYF